MKNAVIWAWFIKNLVGTWRRCDVVRHIDVVTTSCACWEFGPPWPPNILNVAPPPPNILNLPTPMLQYVTKIIFPYLSTVSVTSHYHILNLAYCQFQRKWFLAELSLFMYSCTVNVLHTAGRRAIPHRRGSASQPGAELRSLRVRTPRYFLILSH